MSGLPKTVMLEPEEVRGRPRRAHHHDGRLGRGLPRRGPARAGPGPDRAGHPPGRRRRPAAGPGPPDPETEVPVRLVDLPLEVVVLGAGRCIESYDDLRVMFMDSGLNARQASPDVRPMGTLGGGAKTVSVRFGGVVALDGTSTLQPCERGSDLCPDRPQRGGQDHLLQRGQPHLPAHRGHGHLRRPRPAGRAGPPHRRARHRPHLPEPGAVPRACRCSTTSWSAPTPGSKGGFLSTTVRSAHGRRARSAACRAERRELLDGSTSATWPTGRPPGCPTAP